MRKSIQLGILTALVSVIVPTVMWNLWQLIERRREVREYGPPAFKR